ncbi:hypothetical protein H8356DRAFT_1720876 [Neocallimastix lanati (nom. inval.)]|nr:hypothetical protein H8356DRAFT_1759390 [Neocallimastix sp. JGI-2020a]KAG4082335.1 hypothetical protein H8356DRAFT_1753744 [Neocallimastix sp. JGI-2020a]KAG4086022.1 hypothetical protein H8356DRAFT_1737175 [Neocallimastix sp. JGI-2020a]KAG4088947.1 hypothetical protein H8356DRAFT_1720876 [Neocallimastix sp. JGI-2020a]
MYIIITRISIFFINIFNSIISISISRCIHCFTFICKFYITFSKNTYTTIYNTIILISFTIII